MADRKKMPFERAKEIVQTITEMCQNEEEENCVLLAVQFEIEKRRTELREKAEKREQVSNEQIVKKKVVKKEEIPKRKRFWKTSRKSTGGRMRPIKEPDSDVEIVHDGPPEYTGSDQYDSDNKQEEDSSLSSLSEPDESEDDQEPPKKKVVA